jgi:hypothetical protein
VRRAKSLKLSSFILLLTQLTSINSVGQTSFVGSFSQGRSDVKTDVRNEGPTDVIDSSGLDPTSTVESKNSSPVPYHPEPTALKSRDPEKLGVIDQAYLDAFTILNDANPCSRLFGGPHAIAALNELVQQLKPRYLERDVAIRMSGQTTTVQSYSTGFSFRLFDKAEINLAGSFFRSNSHSERRISISSIFAPNTRETRVIVLLHELGHMVKAADGNWVLFDDGNDQSRSLQNTERVVTVCRQQIDSLSLLTPAQELEMTTSLAQAGSRAQ